MGRAERPGAGPQLRGPVWCCPCARLASPARRTSSRACPPPRACRKRRAATPCPAAPARGAARHLPPVGVETDRARGGLAEVRWVGGWACAVAGPAAAAAAAAAAATAGRQRRRWAACLGSSPGARHACKGCDPPRPRLFAVRRSQGIRGAELAELVQHTPSVLRCAAAAAGASSRGQCGLQHGGTLASRPSRRHRSAHPLSSPALALAHHARTPRSASVDEQLEPLAGLLRWAGASPADVLRAYPDLAAVPVAHLKGSRHVLRQLGVVGALRCRLGPRVGGSSPRWQDVLPRRPACVRGSAFSSRHSAALDSRLPPAPCLSILHSLSPSATPATLATPSP